MRTIRYTNRFKRDYKRDKDGTEKIYSAAVRPAPPVPNRRSI